MRDTSSGGDASGGAAPGESVRSVLCPHGATTGGCRGCVRAAALADATRPLSPVRGAHRVTAASDARDGSRGRIRDDSRDRSGLSARGARADPGMRATARRASLDTRIRAILEDEPRAAGVGGSESRVPPVRAVRTTLLTLSAARRLLAPWGLEHRAALAATLLPRAFRSRTASTSDLATGVAAAAAAAADWRAERAERAVFRVESLAAVRLVTAAATAAAGGADAALSHEYLVGLRVRLEEARRAGETQDAVIRDLTERSASGDRSTSSIGGVGPSAAPHVPYWERRRMVQPSDDTSASNGARASRALGAARHVSPQRRVFRRSWKRRARLRCCSRSSRGGCA